MARKPRAEPEPIEETAPGIGHNLPDELVFAASVTGTAEEWSAHMAGVFAGAMGRLNELLEMHARFKANFPLQPGAPGAAPIGIDEWNDDVYARCASMRDKFREVLKLVENLHEIEKAPVLAASRAIDGAKNGIVQKIGVYDSRGRLQAGADAPLNVIAARTTIYANWIESEKLRAQREEAERLRKEAEAQAAALAEAATPEAFDQAAEAFAVAEQAEKEAEAPASSRTLQHGPTGGSIFLRTAWEFIPDESNVLELAKAVIDGRAPANFLTFDATRIGYEVRSGKPPLRECPGLVIRKRRST